MRCALRTAALVALACPTVAQDEGTWRRPPQVDIDRAIDLGAAHLRASWEREHEDRVRRSAGHATSRAGERALIGYTLLKAGLPRDAPAVQQLVAGLAFEEIGQTYDVACALLLLEAHGAREHRAWIAELAARLLEWQQREYGWGYPSGRDLSNTQYGALGLWAAARAGVPIPPEAWQELSSAVTNYGTKQGGFAYSSGVDGGSTGSMTAAGVGTLALCEMELARLGALESSWGWLMHLERARALAWLAGEFRVDTNPRGGAWTYYWLYGLERMAAFCGLARLGTRDWYGEGAGWLVATQGEDGAWNDRVDTCFAVLFLGRAALASLSPTDLTASTGEVDERRCRTEPQAAVRFEVRPVGERTVFRLLGVRRTVAEALEWPDDARRGLRVLRVEYLADGEVVAVAVGDGTRPSRGHTFPASALLERAPEAFVARVHALVPPGRPGSEQGSADDPAVLLIESPPVACADVAWTRAAPAHDVQNLLRDEGARASLDVSSTSRGFDDLPGVAFPAEAAIDGRPRRPWLARATDRRPTLTFRLRQAVLADTLYVTAARLPGYPPDELARPLELRVRVGDEELELRASMPPDPTRAVRVELGAPLRLRDLELTILSRVPGRRGDVVGLGEVELALEADD